MKRAATSPIQRVTSPQLTINGAKRIKLTTENNSNVALSNDETATNGACSAIQCSYKFISWNVNGLKSLAGKDVLKNLLDSEKPDILCLQETKLQPSAEKKFQNLHDDYVVVLNSCTGKKGYSGTGVLIRKDLFEQTKPTVTKGWSLNGASTAADEEGRIMTIDLPHCYLCNTYVMNSGDKLQRLEERTTEWDPDMLAYLSALNEVKPVVWCGDLNCARTEIDLARPKTNKKTAGFTPQEREQFEKFFEAGFLDSYRELNPGKKDAYTYWSYRHKCREKNLGWRLDYFIISPELKERVKDSSILSNVLGSDHCPIRFEVNFSGEKAEESL
eukprot:CAMPEP_0117435798 /NCGR_PEP_ID=MMETSP0759-20121206/670_1 /TAXON_ID=63605 /ORGANISM="Percolomonas cosmopolitus, Strain WS" /LENGTH=329 /DNA_ID=CAMNT_0005227363 /DNA_START=35 /DNA_END=1024 /DNA_ORIENTATION=+